MIGALQPPRSSSRVAETFDAGQIVIADWRGGLPKEANKLRPAVIVEEDGLFAPTNPNVLLVPLTEDVRLAVPELALALEPTAANGCSKRCWALSQMVTATSKQRITGTSSRITAEQLMAIRRQIAVAIGL
jgi:mRNA interferase MazF